MTRELEGDAEISEDEDGSTDQQRDGMADMMSRILSQKIDGKVPVLAKRKTVMMKALEEEAENLRNTKKLKASRPTLPANVELQLLDKDSSIDFERQLKKLATRGVVALFNAISKSKRGAMGGVGDNKEGADSSRNQNANDDDDDDSWHSKDVEESTLAKSSSGKSTNKVVSSNSSSKRPSNSNSNKSGDSTASGKSTSTKKWSVFEEDSIGQRKLTLKNWDQENNSDDEKP